MAATEHRPAPPQAGFTLIEVLVTLFILTVGLLGLVGMQVMAQRSELESYQRAQAMVLMSDIVDRINTNRKAATCYAVTTNAGSGTPWLGSTAGSGADKYNVAGYSCPDVAMNNAIAAERAKLDLQFIDSMLQGAAEQLGAGSVGAMIGARACIGFDSERQSFTVAVAWQGINQTWSPALWPAANNPEVARNCAFERYGAGDNDRQRRVVWTTLLVASLN